RSRRRRGNDGAYGCGDRNDACAGTLHHDDSIPQPATSSQCVARSARLSYDVPMVLRRNLIILLAIACGVAVANLHYNQPLLESLGRSFGTDPARTGLIATCSQAGYAAGMLAFVPLIDLIERRR